MLAERPVILYLLCETIQALVSAANYQVLPDSDETDWVRGKLNAVLGFVQLPAKQNHVNLVAFVWIIS